MPVQSGHRTYELQEGEDGGWVTISSDALTSESVSGKPTGVYGYRVRSCNNFGCSNYSESKEVEVVLPIDAPLFENFPTQTDIDGDFTIKLQTGYYRYYLEEKYNNGPWVSKLTASASRSFSTSDRPNGTYQYQVRGCELLAGGSSNCSDWRSSGVFNVLLPPSAPASLDVPESGDVTNGSYAVSWASAATATSYVLEERVNTGGYIEVYRGDDLSESFTDRRNATYRYRVAACNASGCSASWTYSAVLSAPGGANKPTGPVEDLDGEYTITWKEVAQATSYVLSTTSGAEWHAFPATTNLSKEEKWKSSGNHSYKVSACNNFGCGPESSVLTVKVHLPPVAPTFIEFPASMNIDGDFTIKLQTGYYRYYLDEQKDGGDWIPRLSASSSTSYPVAGRDNGTYVFRAKGCQIYAGGSTGCSEYRISDPIEVLLPPPAPASLDVPESGDVIDVIEISWSESLTATHYELEESKNSGIYVPVYSDTLVQTTTAPEEGTYKYRVRACNTSGCSATWTYSTLLQPPIETTSTSSPVDNFSGEFTVTWSDVAQARTYKLSEASGGDWVAIYNDSEQKFKVTGRETKNYAYRVQGCNYFGCGPFGTGSITKVFTKPNAPGGFTLPAEKDISDSIEVEWNRSENAEAYDIELKVGSAGWDKYIKPYYGTTITIPVQEQAPHTFRVAACNSSGCSDNYTTSWTLSGPGAVTFDQLPSEPVIDGTFEISWNSGTKARNYLIEESVNNGDWNFIYYPTNRTLYEVKDRPSGSYRYRIQSRNAFGTVYSEPSTAIIVQRPATPNKPSIQVTPSGNNSDGRAKFSWLIQQGAKYFEVWLQEEGGEPWLAKTITDVDGDGGPSPLISATVTSLNSGKYTAKIGACNALSDIPCNFSETGFFWVARKPTLTGSVTTPVGTVSDEGFNVSWNASPDMLEDGQYVLEVSINDDQWVELLSEPSTTSYRLNTPFAGDYLFRVKACHGPSLDSCSEYRTGNAFKVIGTPNRVDSVDVYHEPAQPEDIRVTWTGPAFNGELSYKVYVEFNYVKDPLPVYTGALEYFDYFAGTGYGNYRFEVLACNEFGTCGLSHISSKFVHRKQPVIPQGLSATTPDLGRYTVSWNEVSDEYVTSIILEERQDDVVLQRHSLKSSDISLSIEQDMSASYQYRIAACDHDICSQFSAPINVNVVLPNETDLPTEYAGPTVGNYSSSALVVGSIPAKEQVNPDGSYSYSMPIVTSGGINGLLPALAISYNSNGQDGSMGRGFSLSGAAAITRCPKNQALDGKSRGIRFTSEDRFCLNGMRLVTSEDNYGAVGVNYYTAIDSFVEVTSIGGELGNPASFQVRHTDGSTAYYGIDDANIVAPVSGKTFLWALQKHVDSSGNYIQYHYKQESESLEYHLSKVSYTANQNTGLSPQSEIEIFYREGALKPQVGFINGETTGLTKTLDRVVSRSDGHLLREYSFDYDTLQGVLNRVDVCNDDGCLPPTTFKWELGSLDPTKYFGQWDNIKVYSDNRFKGFKPGDVNGDGKLDLVVIQNERNDSSDHVRVMLAEGDRFTPQDRLKDFADKDLRGTWQLIDINGDNAQDILFIRKIDGQGYWSYVLAENDNYDPDSVVVTDIAIDYRKPPVIADFDGDGFADLFYKENDDFAIRRLLDFEELDSEATTVHINFTPFTGGSYHKYEVETKEPDKNTRVSDFDGNGLADLILKVTEYTCTDGSYSQCQNVREDWRIFTSGALGQFYEYANLGATDDISDIRLTDLNSDGYTDVFYSQSQAQSEGQFAYQYNNGKSLEPIVLIPEVNSDNNISHLVDLNLDGYTDLVYAGVDTAAEDCDGAGRELGICLSKYPRSWWLMAFDGQNFADPVQLPLEVHNYQQSFFADANGDGFADYVSFDGDLGFNLRVDRPVKRISDVTDGFGVTSEINYRPLTDSTVYQRAYTNIEGADGHQDTTAWGSGTMVMDITYPMHVVSSFERGEVVNTYRYENGRMQVGRGALGFEKLTIHNLTTGIQQTSIYRQDYPFVGSLIESRTELVEVTWHKNEDCRQMGTTGEYYCHEYNIEQRSSQLLGESYSTYMSHPTHDGLSQFIYANSSTEYSYDLDGTDLTTKVITVNEVDYFGHIVDVTEQLKDHINDVTASKQTVDLFDNDTHFGGRKTRSEITLSRTAEVPVTRTNGYRYDALGLLVEEIVEPDDIDYTLTTTYTRDSFGNVDSVTVDGQNIPQAVSSTSYESTGRYVETSTDANGYVARNLYTPWHLAIGGPQSIGDINDNFTQLYYGTLGRAEGADSPDGGQVRKAYQWCADVHPAGVVSSDCPSDAVYVEITETAGAPVTKVFFDGFGRKRRESTMGFNAGDWINTDFVYDDKGRLEQQSQPYLDGHTPLWTSMTFDELNRVSTMTKPDDGLWTYEYDDFTETLTNPAGLSHSESKNAMGELISVTDAAVDVTDANVFYRYDAAGNLKELEDGQNNITYIDYDRLGRKISMTDPDKGVWTYTYDQLGRIKATIDGNGDETRIFYRADGQVHSKYRYKGTKQNGYQVQKYYASFRTSGTGKGQVNIQWVANTYEGVEASTHYQTFSYDSLGRPYRVKHKLPNFTEMLGKNAVYTETEFDTVGRARDVMDASGQSIRYFYNPRGYKYAVADLSSGNLIWQANEADAYGNITEFEHGNGIVTHKSFYQETGLAESISSTKQAITYQWDQLGNLDFRNDQWKNLNESFTYDGLNRVTSSTIAGQDSLSYQYDTLGNITYKSGVGDYYYEAGKPHAVSRITGDTGDQAGVDSLFTYDNNGNMLTGDGRTIEYTSFDKPYRISKGDYIAEFQYGIGDSRFKRFDREGDKLTVTYYIGNVEMIQTSDAPGYTTKRYIDGEAVITRYFDGVSPIYETHYLHGDHLGSIDLITDAAGSVVERLSYDVWGARRASNWADPLDQLTMLSRIREFSSNITTRGYTGHEHIDGVGLIHMNGRVYDARLGRFLSADPHVQAPNNTQSLNRYSYVFNNPLNATDPSGYIAQMVIAMAIKYIAANVIGGALGSAITGFMAAYSYFGMAQGILQSVSAIMNAYDAWSAGAGGAVLGATITGVAKGWAKSIAMSYLASSVEGYFNKADGPTRIGTSYGEFNASKSNELSFENQVLKGGSGKEPKNPSNDVKVDDGLNLKVHGNSLRGDILVGCEHVSAYMCINSIKEFQGVNQSDGVYETNLTIRVAGAGEEPTFQLKGGGSNKDFNGKYTLTKTTVSVLVADYTTYKRTIHLYSSNVSYSSETAVHEMGHMLGLQHQENKTGSVMSYDINRNSVPVTDDLRRLVDAYR
ncbi:RHS repeat-associated core domain-containing protein [Corallincola spongiicola]|nr:RHS repeat-associated core domain-containing protein [Corallincola spongiicola]